jgi:biotin-dependent carboxylase-like uncharacterized protein
VTAALAVEVAGPLTTVQDLGRPGLAHLGVATSGAADRRSLRLANAAVGNPEDAAALEVTLGPLVVRARGEVVVAVAGMAVDLDVDDRPVAGPGPFPVPDGSLLRLRRGRGGVRCYLAVRGGVLVPPALGSRSTDLLAGLGPDVLRAGTLLPVGDPGAVVGPASHPQPAAAVAQPLRVVPGPRADWFAADVFGALTGTTWTVATDSNRVALRLGGPVLARRDGRELPSEGVARGAVQVPPSGRPVVFLADHPVTGGYPVLGVVVDEDTDRAAQLRPGEAVRFAVHPAPDLDG